MHTTTDRVAHATQRRTSTRQPRVAFIRLSLAAAITLLSAVSARRGAAQDSTKAADSARAAAAADSLHGRTPRHHGDTTSLAPMTITAAPPPPNMPAMTVTITQAEIATAPANSPWELLRQTTGLEAHEQGQGPGFASDISVRGFSSDHSTDIALWVDGVPINEPVNGHAEGYNDLNLIFPQAVSGIDVLKGPVSALYGNFAFSGIINVRTIERMNGTQAEVTGGSFGNLEGSVLTGFDHGVTSGVLGIRGWHDDGWREHSSGNLGQLHGRLIQELSAKTTLDLGVELYATSYDSPGFLDTASYAAGDYNIVSNFGDGGTKQHAQERASLGVQVSDAMLWRTTLFATQGLWNFWLSTPPGLGGLLEGSGVETREYDKRYGGGLTSAMTYTAKQTEISFGLQAQYDHSHYENWAQAVLETRQDSAPNALAMASQSSGGIFAQANFNANSWLRVLLGARLDGLSTSSQQPDSLGQQICNGWNDHAMLTCSTTQHSKNIFSPKMGLLAQATHWLGIYVNASKGFRQEDGVILDPTVPYITVWQYETGVQISGGGLNLQASVFRMDLSNDQSSNGQMTIGGGPSVRKGIDLTGSYVVIPGLTLSTAVTFLDAKYTTFVDPDTEIDYSGATVFNTSTYVGIFTVNETPPHSIWQFQLSTNFQGPYTPFEEEIGLTRPAFALLNGYVGVRLWSKWNLSLAMRNILDTAYRELESGYFVTPGQPRTVYAKLQFGP